jgi:uncharacterized protein YjbI with pentapeptide repeats
MKTLKPLALSVLHGPFERQGRVYLCVVVAAMTSFDGTVLEHEQTMWKMLATMPGFGGGLDELRPKVKSEVVVLGSAFAPPNRKVTARSVKVEVGPIAKELVAVGDRFWKGGVPTEPVPFETMPLTWENAFGGEGYTPNPVGKGFAPMKTESGDTAHHLPNIETPKKLVTSPNDRPVPASFSPVDPSWQRRIGKLGTYDKKWLDTRYPDFPDDFDPTYFNVAPEDQWLEGHFSGGERVVIEHMHPTKERIEGEIPRLQARCFVSREGDLVRDLPMRCDTIWILPHVERMILVFRAFTEVVDDEASDVLDVMFALERAGEARPMSHYTKVREKRLDKDKGAIWSMREKDLVPDGMKGGKAVDQESLDALLAREGLAEKVADARAQVELDRAREAFRENGIDPDTLLPREIPKTQKGPDLDDMGEFVEKTEAEAYAAIAETEKKMADKLVEMRELCKTNGLDFDKMMADAKKGEGGPPKFSARAEMERLREMEKLQANSGVELPEVAKLLDEDLEAKLEEAEKDLKDAYRKFVHLMPSAPETPEEERARLRAAMMELLAEGASLTDRDFTGADLSGIDFSGRDLSRSFFERARLDGCRFVGANLEDTVLARASLRDAIFERANLKRCNMGEAILAGAKMGGGVDASECVIAKADLSGADLTKIKLDKADIAEAKFEGADLSGATASELTVLRSDFRGVKLRNARIEKSNLLNIDLSGVDLRGVSLPGTVLLDVKADKANFDGADLESLRVVKAEEGCSLVGATFRGANMRGAFLRGANLEGADLSDAILDGADFSRCNLKNARLDHARARDSRFLKTDLTGASLEGTDLMQALMGGIIVRGARFERASLFRADLGRAVGDDKTSFRGANVNFVRRMPRQNG